jgi:beta-galactosidase
LFNGNTQTSLGYYTIKCNPQTGKKLKIQLAATSQVKGNDTGVEVNGKKLDDGVLRNDANAKGTLSIIEVEVYEKIDR